MRTAENILVDSDEGGWVLILDVEGEEVRFNIHGVASQLARECAKLNDWLTEGERSAISDPRVWGPQFPPDDQDDDDAYALDDPKRWSRKVL